MKRIILLFLFVFLIGVIIGILSCSNKTFEVTEEIFPISDNLGNVVGENINLTIPDGYNEKYVDLSPSILDGFKHFRGKENFLVKISIINNSSNSYSYVFNSFDINTAVPNDYKNYKVFGVGFDGLKIYDSYYRSYNDALISLVGSMELTDININNELINLGYTGLNELDKYYIDYYGDNYLDYIFLGRVSSYKESNRNLVIQAYKYFYNNIININNDGIYNYINNSYLIDNILNSNININKYNDINLFSIDLSNNEVFSNYLYNLKFSCKLKKEHS